MLIRTFQPEDCKQMADLFYSTVHTICIQDYTKEQLDVWATGSVDLEHWNQSFLEHDCYIALEHHTIIGFGDIDQTRLRKNSWLNGKEFS